MTKNEVIRATLQAMRGDKGLLATRSQEAAAYESVVVTTLNERLPTSEFKTCADFALGVECCETCHTFCPHYDMYFERLSTREHAWICCSVRSALCAIAAPL